MSTEKFRTKVFVTSRLTVNGEMVLPYGTSAPSLATNGDIAVAHVTGTAKMFVRSGGTTYTLNLLGTVVGA